MCSSSTYLRVIVYFTLFMVNVDSVKARHVNIALIVTNERDVSTVAVKNSLEWAQKYIIRGRGVTLNIIKIVVKENEIFNDEVFAKNISSTSFILQPYYIDRKLCILSELFSIPLVTVSDLHMPMCNEYTLNILPNPFQTIEVLNALLEEESIVSLGVIIEEQLSSFAVSIISYITELNRVRDYRILGNVNMSSEMSINNIASKVLNENYYVILLVMQSHDSIRFISNMELIGNLSNIEWYLLTPPTTTANTVRIPIKSKVTWFTIPIHSSNFKQVEKQISEMKTAQQRSFKGYLTLSPSIHDAMVTIATTIKHNQFYINNKKNHFPQCKIAKSKHRNVRSLSAKMKGIHFEGLTGDVQFTNYTGYRNYTNLEVHGVDTDGRVSVVGRWSEECQLFHWRNGNIYLKGHSTNQCKRKPKKRKLVINLRKKRFKIIVVPDEPFIFYNSSQGKGNERFTGFCKDLLDKIAEELGFAYDLVVVPGSSPSYGSCEMERRGEPCVWNGLIGEIVSKRADIGIGSVTITSEREQYVDFSKPFMDFTMTLIMEKKPEKEFDIFAFLKPFEPAVWTSIICVAFCVTIMLFIIDRYSPSGYRKLATDESNEYTGNEFAFHNCMWFTTASLLQQGPDYTPRSSSARVLSATFWFFTLIVISTYTANLAAFFTTKQRNTGIKSLEDLGKQDQVKYGILGRGQTYSMFKNSEVVLYKQMFSFMETEKTFALSSTAGVERVRKGGYAYLSEDPIIIYQHQRKPCNTAVLRNLLEAKSYGLVLQSHSEWTNPLSVVILDLREQGFIEKLRRKWWDDKSECTYNTDMNGQPISLSMSNLAGVYIIMIGGILTAVVFLIVEMKYKKVFLGKLMQQEYVFKKKSYSIKKELELSTHMGSNGDIIGHDSPKCRHMERLCIPIDLRLSQHMIHNERQHKDIPESTL